MLVFEKHSVDLITNLLYMSRLTKQFFLTPQVESLKWKLILSYFSSRSNLVLFVFLLLLFPLFLVILDFVFYFLFSYFCFRSKEFTSYFNYFAIGLTNCFFLLYLLVIVFNFFLVVISRISIIFLLFVDLTYGPTSM